LFRFDDSVDDDTRVEDAKLRSTWVGFERGERGDDDDDDSTGAEDRKLRSTWVGFKKGGSKIERGAAVA
jgi:hypothetical protein